MKRAFTPDFSGESPQYDPAIHQLYAGLAVGIKGTGMLVGDGESRAGAKLGRTMPRRLA